MYTAEEEKKWIDGFDYNIRRVHEEIRDALVHASKALAAAHADDDFDRERIRKINCVVDSLNHARNMLD